ncbi:uncharacterized protein PHACADRAFT_192598 [Phanerochaete carnosa HHB-10118-sp]|uniref:Uncharacterized protein n=1 Tax=Phanerochaete carnosa (strain HHB-10118-sp) TaxID=650164 RepID=K5WDU3_PHACS|nr:uncharacterized protein PHACADRAFT_192598 [Phanerochaete carnosa HHB-10118-sp]EKM57450.1 hypothetical protein PHACADRAFT_192598 [Phanerochaete carnosa HHB-10118-sp]
MTLRRPAQRYSCTAAIGMYSTRSTSGGYGDAAAVSFPGWTATIASRTRSWKFETPTPLNVVYTVASGAVDDHINDLSVGSQVPARQNIYNILVHLTSLTVRPLW